MGKVGSNQFRAHHIRPIGPNVDIDSFHARCQAAASSSPHAAEAMGRAGGPVSESGGTPPSRVVCAGRTCKSNRVFPVPVYATLDGVDMKFEAGVVRDVFPAGICLGPQELRCYNISRQEPTGEARVDERASLVVSFMVHDAAPIPLRGLVDTGSGVFILTFPP